MVSEDTNRIRTLLHVLIDDGSIPFTEVSLLVDAVDHEDGVIRVSAAWALCLLAERRPSHAASIFERLTDAESDAAALARTWLNDRYGDDWVDERGGVEPADRDNPLGRRAVRTTRRDRDGVTNPSVIQGSRDEREPERRPTRGVDEADESEDASERPGRPAGRRRSEDERSGTLRRFDRWDDEDSPEPDRPDEVVEDGRLTVSTESTDPDSIRILTRATNDRYAWTYVGAGRLYGRQREFLLRTYVPPPTVINDGFERGFREMIERWTDSAHVEGVASVIDWGEHPDPWIITDFATDTVASTDRLDPRAAFEAGLELTTAVASLHQSGTTHGCLSPTNVFLDRSGDGSRPRITDVGIGTVIDTEQWLPTDGAYAAPELTRDGYGSVDWMTDVYHLGTILYTLFTGRRLPQEAADPERSIPAPTSVDPDLPTAADIVVSKATGPHKVTRYESADELGRDLRSAIDEHWGTSA